MKRNDWETRLQKPNMTGINWKHWDTAERNHEKKTKTQACRDDKEAARSRTSNDREKRQLRRNSESRQKDRLIETAQTKRSEGRSKLRGRNLQLQEEEA